MKRAATILATLMAALSLPASARLIPASKYQPATMMGGYEDEEIEPGVWRVKARSNGPAGHGAAQNMAAYRAAEILASKGFTHMQVIDQKGVQHGMRSGSDVRPVGER